MAHTDTILKFFEIELCLKKIFCITWTDIICFIFCLVKKYEVKNVH